MLQALFQHIELFFTGRHDGKGLPGSLKSPVFWFLVVSSLAAFFLRVAIWGVHRYEWWELIVANLAFVGMLRFFVREEVYIQAVACFLLSGLVHEVIFILLGWLPEEVLLMIDLLMAFILVVNIDRIGGDEF